MPMTANASTSVSMDIHIGDAPPPPIVAFREEPHVVVVPNSTVYVVDRGYDFDCFRYGVYWYMWNGDYWYRARSYRGPFAAVQARYVPVAIISVPARHWRHHPHGGPPGLMKRQRADVVVVKEKRGRGHGRD
jgi:hypothetical protein